MSSTLEQLYKHLQTITFHNYHQVFVIHKYNVRGEKPGIKKAYEVASYLLKSRKHRSIDIRFANRSHINHHFKAYYDKGTEMYWCYSLQILCTRAQMIDFLHKL